MSEPEISPDAEEAMKLLREQGYSLEWHKGSALRESGIFGATASEVVKDLLPGMGESTLYQGILFHIYPREGRYEWRVPGVQGEGEKGPANSFVEGALAVIAEIKVFAELLRKHRPRG